ncbi:DUF4956 domain-containing protein [Nanoarchaeota archaeon]
MVKSETFEQFLTTTSADINLIYVIISILLAAFLSFILSRIYTKYGTSISNRRKFAGNFILLSTTTTLIIIIVKSSLALSLGLVGALSIVRFRAAIKEPEELGFLFLNISLGLGLGANQFAVTIIAFTIISLLIMLRKFSHEKNENQNLTLTITSHGSGRISLDKLTGILKKHCDYVHLKRFDSTKDLIDAAFFVTFSSFSRLDNLKRELKNLSKSIKLTYLDKG